MFENIILGPICYFRTREELKFQCEDLLHQDWLPLIVTNKGDMFERVKSDVNPTEPLLGIIISIGYKNPYKA